MLVLLIILTFAVSLYAQYRVKSTYDHYCKIPSMRGMTGAEAAHYILRSAGIHDVKVVPVRGFLTDYYHPQKKLLALSETNYHGNSLAALGVAAHESGHALQHAAGYTPLNLRMALVPVTTFCSKLLPIIMITALFGLLGPALSKTMLFAVVGIYMVLTLFQLVTLPVEFDASRRARKQLLQLGILDQREIEGVSRTLDAAALTYVAAFVSTLVWMLYYFTLANRR
jgi:Zn-dependent membrane protease YugP